MSQDDNKVKVWDLSVRIFHWSLVTFFVLSYLTGDELGTVHAWSGYGIVTLLAYRVLWGLVGTRYARFSHFIYGPARIKSYLKSLLGPKPEHYYGHNPAGGLMVLLLLISLSLSCFTGLKAYAEEGHGPLADAQIALISPAYAGDDEHDNKSGDGKHEGDEFWEEVHEFFVNLTLFLIIVHISGVFIAGRLHRENLVKPMINGYKDPVE